jgi:hypothetical protein
MRKTLLLSLCLLLCLAPSAALGQKTPSSSETLLPKQAFEKVSLDSPQGIMEALSGQSAKDLKLSQAKIYIKVVAGGPMSHERLTKYP